MRFIYKSINFESAKDSGNVDHRECMPLSLTPGLGRTYLHLRALNKHAHRHSHKIKRRWDTLQQPMPSLATKKIAQLGMDILNKFRIQKRFKFAQSNEFSLQKV